MTTARHLMWPLLVIALGGLWLLSLANAFPDAAGDLLGRVWPALLVLFGFDVLLGRRRVWLGRRSVGLGAVGLLVLIALVAALVWVAYNRQADTLRRDNVQTLSQALPDEVDRVRVEIDVRRTEVALHPSADTARMVDAVFTGSNESKVALDWDVAGGVGTLTVHETQPEPLPHLADYGRGRLEVALPRGVTVEYVGLDAARGDITADLRPLDVERIDLKSDSGDFAVYLPEINVMQGSLTAGSGAVHVYVPPEMRLLVTFVRGRPRYEYDTSRYDLLADGTLKHKDGEPYQYSLDVATEGGARLIIEDLTSGAQGTS